MNTHDIDIELPPLPHLPLNDPAAAYKAVHDYGQQCATAAIQADRKRRGEPVADENKTLRIAGCISRHLNATLDQSSVMAAATEIAGFTAPQPAEPVKGLSE